MLGFVEDVCAVIREGLAELDPRVQVPLQRKSRSGKVVVEPLAEGVVVRPICGGRPMGPCKPLPEKKSAVVKAPKRSPRSAR